ncbi:MAG: ATP-binding cassette domain-containing protein [Lachnospiraceae bacterium]|nr:ATP-binding cassette domain-containing protein [Lachnospiraceae bacterium]
MVDYNKEPLLRIEHLCQYFGPTKAVDDVSFDVYPGEVFGLVGESGCGKTTTGRSIIKLYDITSGNIYFRGQRIGAGVKSYKDAIKAARKELKTADETRRKELEETIAKNREEIKKAKFDQKHSDKEYAKIAVEETKQKFAEKIENAATAEEKSALRKEMNEAVRIAKNTKIVTKIQMIFQDPIASLDPRMTVREIISEGLRINGIKDEKYIDEKVYQMLELVGLVREHAGRYPHEFSGGQRQRIGIARSIIMEPEMLIADEPISALDVSIQAQVINLLNELREDLGLTILFIAHDLSVVKYFSNRIGVMYYGNMVELAETEELFAHPMHPYTKSLLSAIPLPDPRTEKKRTRIIYNALAEHDYSVQKPTMREIIPGHFVYCNDAEEAKYRKEFDL